MKLVHPTIAALVGMAPVTAGWVVMGLLYLVYAADVVATSITAAGLADELDTLEKIADGIHDVSDAMTGPDRLHRHGRRPEAGRKPAAAQTGRGRTALRQRKAVLAGGAGGLPAPRRTRPWRPPAGPARPPG